MPVISTPASVAVDVSNLTFNTRQRSAGIVTGGASTAALES
jgi:hypothetical protein